MLKIESGWDGHVGEEDQLDIEELHRKFHLLASSIGISEEDLAVIHTSTHLGAHIGPKSRINLSDFNPLARIRFATEFSRLFDGVHDVSGRTPNFSMSLIFGCLGYDGTHLAVEDTTHILRNTINETFASFVGASIVFGVQGGEEIGGFIKNIGPTGGTVDRRAHYEGLYTGDFASDFNLELDGTSDGQLPVRGHFAEVANGLHHSYQVDLDLVENVVSAGTLISA